MFLRMLRQTHWLALAGACATSACSGNKPEVPDAFVASFVQDTTAGGTCNVDAQTTIVAIGEVTSEKPATVDNNGVQAGGTVTVTCSVKADNGGFDVQLDAQQVGPQGGNIRISSSGQGGVTLSGGTVSVTLTNTNAAGSYSESDCMVSWTYQGEPLSDPSLLGSNPPVAPGRIWGHISCPMATETLTSPVVTCDGEADILFENCSE